MMIYLQFGLLAGLKSLEDMDGTGRCGLSLGEYLKTPGVTSSVGKCKRGTETQEALLID